MRDFLENRPGIAKAGKVLLEKPTISPLLHSHLQKPTSDHQEDPRLELRHDAQGKIKEIIVICHCGERTVLQCTY